MNTTHERIKKLLSKRRMSQIQFAMLLDITPARLNNYLTGKAETNHAILVKMAETLETSTDYILGHKESYLSQKRMPTPYEIIGISEGDNARTTINDNGTISISYTASGKTIAVIKLFAVD